MRHTNGFIKMYFIGAVKEGIALVENGLSPYSGDVFHEVSLYCNGSISMRPYHILCYTFLFRLQTPLVLLLFKFLLVAGEAVVGLFFVVCGM